LKVTTAKLKQMKQAGEPIVGLTAWDFPSAYWCEQAGADLILVGDSLSMTIKGDPNTLFITLDEMIYHLKMVTKAVTNALVVGDMPFMSYHISPEQAAFNAGRFLKEGGAQAVKIEGGHERVETVKKIVSCGIPVMGHIGLTPQAVHQLGGFKVQAKEIKEAAQLIKDAQELEKAGVFALILECIPDELAKQITAKVKVPTIGIGAGIYCDGQIQVTADLIGLREGPAPKHARKYLDVNGSIKKGLKQYALDVKSGKFPTLEQTFATPAALKDYLNGVRP
jgi:3-methyl-2-oxobutanoate hydroxymethyltransferase